MFGNFFLSFSMQEKNKKNKKIIIRVLIALIFQQYSILNINQKKTLQSEGN